jgi:hypothetical protein
MTASRRPPRAVPGPSGVKPEAQAQTKAKNKKSKTGKSDPSSPRKILTLTRAQASAIRKAEHARRNRRKTRPAAIAEQMAQKKANPGKSGPKVIDWTRPFLLALGKMGIVRYACLAANVSPDSVYKRKAADPVFAAKYKEAQEWATDVAVQEAWRRAVEGVEKIVPLGRGEHTTEKNYSDGLLLALLRARRPQEFGNKVEVTDGGAAQHLTLEEMRARNLEAKRKLESTDTGAAALEAAGVPLEEHLEPVEPTP